MVALMREAPGAGMRRSLGLALLVVSLAGAVGAQSPEYRIGPLDVLKITVWGQDDLSRTVAVSVDGSNSVSAARRRPRGGAHDGPARGAAEGASSGGTTWSIPR